MKCLLVAALALALLALAGPASSADEKKDTKGQKLEGDPKRKPQDYGGPPADPPDAVDIAIWIPRILFFPLRLIADYLIRRPLGALTVVAEREQWPQELMEFFTFGDRRQVTVYPSAMLDFGLKPSVGFNLSWKYFGAEANTLKVHFGTWGPDWIAVRLTDTYAISKTEAVGFDGSFVRRRDNPFYGLGPRSGNQRERFETFQTEAAITYAVRPWRASAFEARAGMRSLAFGEQGCCDEPNLFHEVRTGRVEAPTGLGNGYVGAFQRLSAVLDTRRSAPHQGSGVRVEGRGEGVFPLDERGDGPRRSWVKYGGAIGGAVDLTGTQQVLSLQFDADFADPLNGTIPFPDQITLGGDNPMRGFLRSRLVDRSAAVATLTYNWPIWVFLDGTIHVAVGNVFGEHLSGFEPKLLRASSGIGVRSNGSRESAFEILVAGGTDPFEEGFNVSNLRLVVGSHHGF